MGEIPTGGLAKEPTNEENFTLPRRTAFNLSVNFCRDIVRL